MTNWRKVQRENPLDRETLVKPKAKFQRWLGNTIQSRRISLMQNLFKPKRPNPYAEIKQSRHDVPHSFSLQVTGGGNNSENIKRITHDGMLHTILIDFPLGSHHEYKVSITVNNAPIFDDLRGNGSVKTFNGLQIPVKEGTEIITKMVIDPGINSNRAHEVFIDYIWRRTA